MGNFAAKMDLFNQFLTTRVATHKVYSTNIANAETPGFKEKIPHFEAKLSKAMQSDDTGEVAKQWNLSMKTTNSRDASNLNGNNVNLDQQMALMSQNTMRYLSGVKIYGQESGLLRYAITSSRR